MKRLGVAIIVLIIGAAAGWFIRGHFSGGLSDNVPLHILRENSPEYHYTNPLLLASSDASNVPEYSNLSNKINAYIKSIPSADQVSDVSVYYQDLNTGRWVGVNENELYDPASVTKVAMMMAYMKEAQDNPSIFNQTYVYSGNDNDAEVFKPLNPLTQGQSYTVRDLIIAMIDQSDNVALRILQDNLPDSYLTGVLDTLNLPHPVETSTTTDYISAKDISRLFRVLYNGTYLYPENSEQALGLLTQTQFTEGLVAGVASSTEVAHKFGERTLNDSSGNVIDRELHDCGIVYYPISPYLLCVMTKGQTYPTLEKVIQDISAMVYADEDSIAKSNGVK